MTATDRAVAPTAPGRLGQAISSPDLLAYLDALGRWRDGRRQELDRLDSAALRAADADAYTGDLTLAMTMWQSVEHRLERLKTVWDSGRVGPQQREEMSRLIWGTGSELGSASGGLGLSLVEATRLSDALTASLRARLSFDPAAADIAARIAATRAGLQRIAEARLDPRTARPAVQPDIDALRRRLEDLSARAALGADVTGPFTVLEAEAARAERDLIVAAASHRDLSRDYRATLERRRDLEAQEDVLRALVGRVAAAVTPAPRMAVPDVERLGRVPQERVALDAYRTRLETVGRALALASQTYGDALAEVAELCGRLQALAAKAAAGGQAGDPVISAVHDLTATVLRRTPCPVPQARELVAAYQRLLGATPAGGSA